MVRYAYLLFLIKKKTIIFFFFLNLKLNFQLIKDRIGTEQKHHKPIAGQSTNIDHRQQSQREKEKPIK